MKRSSFVPFLLAAPLCLATVAPLRAQASRNVTLLGSYKATTSQGYNDIWGYHAPDGRELAIMGSSLGTHIVETTVPTKPVSRGFIRYAVRASTWRDMKAFGPYAYIVTESDGYMQIIDLRNPTLPKLVKNWNGPWTHAHNIAMDFERGIAVVVGTSGRTGYTYFVDVKTNPTLPKVVGRYYGNYQHDVSVQNGYMYGSAIYAGLLEVYDVRNLAAIKRLGSIRTPRFFTHNTWPTRDDNYVVTTDERSAGPMGIYDVTKKSLPKYVAQYRANPTTSPSAIIHNAFVNHRIAHIAYYTEGYRCVDISNPAKPVEVGYYDNYGGTSSGYNGHWGCHSFQPSGIVYASDRAAGLLVLKPKATPVYYGKSTAGSAGRVPEIHPFGSTYLGNGNYKVSVENAKAGALAILMVGLRKSSTTVGGLTFLVDMATAGGFVAVGMTGTTGKTTLPAGIPSLTALSGTKAYAQFLVLDSGGSLGFSATQGMEVELFIR